MTAIDRQPEHFRLAAMMMLFALMLQTLAPMNEVLDVFADDPGAADIAHHQVGTHTAEAHATDEHTHREECQDTGHSGCHAHQHMTPLTLAGHLRPPRMNQVPAKLNPAPLFTPATPVTGIYRPPIA